MTDLRVIIREFAKGTPLREIERRLGISRTSLRPYKERAEQSGKSMQELLQLEDAELHSVLSNGDNPGKPYLVTATDRHSQQLTRNNIKVAANSQKLTSERILQPGP